MLDDHSWALDEPCGVVGLSGQSGHLRLRAQAREEAFTSHTLAREFVPLSVTHGRRTVVLAQFYTTEAELMPRGLRSPRIGEGSAYYYQVDMVLLMWRCNLLARYRGPDPMRDDALRLLWEQFESLLRRQFPATRQIITPTWNRPYEETLWRAFIAARGFNHPSPAGLPGMAQIKNLTSAE